MARKTQTTSQGEKKQPLESRGLYAYGVVEKGANCNGIVGIDNKHPVYAIEGRSVSVLVSEIDIQHFQRRVQELYNEIANSGGVLQEQSGAILQAHENVIDSIMQQHTIIPLKFGTILKYKSSAVLMLQDQEPYFRSLLEKFKGKVECGVKVYADQQALMQYLAQTEKREEPRQERQKTNLSKGTAYLLGRKKEEAQKETVMVQFAQAAEKIFQKLSREAFAAKKNDILPKRQTGKKKEMILNSAYLVATENIPHFYQSGQRLMKDYAFMNLEVDFSGPWPPYNFTEDSE